METRSREIKSRNQPQVSMRVTPGHFATRHSHINYYVDMTNIKCLHVIARLAARELAAHYVKLTPVDTIVCLDGTEVIAAFLAAALSDGDSRGINAGSQIAILTPEINTSGQLMFRDNMQSMIWNRNVLLLVASVTTGNTITQARECIDYYSGNISGICAIFSAIPEVGDIAVHTIFTVEDVAGYATYSPADCPDCRAKRKIDALVNSFGYSRI
jgi:orotate phosphoribosyltransferase